MADANPSDDRDLPAGDFSSWMVDVQAAIRGERGSDVPCNGCSACCTSSQFVHIGPDETETLAHIPSELLFPAPGLPRGHVVLGYDERGRCPMLIDDQCSIYEHRPTTCRAYDCRIFPAAGVELDEAEKVLIAQRARRWRFTFPTDTDQTQHDAIRAAAAFLVTRSAELPHDDVPKTATQRAVLAIELRDVFLHHDDRTGSATLVEPDVQTVRVELRRRKERGHRSDL